MNGGEISVATEAGQAPWRRPEGPGSGPGSGAAALGLGCGDLYGGDRAAHSERLVRTAFDAGVRHFDVARLYGDGSAEGVVGRALKPVRDQVRIVTKAGITPWSMQTGRRTLRKAAGLARRLPPLRAVVPEPPPARERYGAFHPQELRRSVELSLKALGVDHVDALLLHECDPVQALAAETRETLGALVKAGKIGSWGLATHLGDTLAILEADAEPPGLVQIGSDALSRNLDQLPPGPWTVITHSALKRALTEATRRLQADPALARLWAAAVGAPPSDVERTARVLLDLARRDNPDGVVLFSTSRPERIASMVGPSLPAEVLEAARRALDEGRSARPEAAGFAAARSGGGRDPPLEHHPR
jgi:aryl-alcohol dehydrogenase-like predicted oxidoreductase